jgi:hypothetical protein
MRFLAESASVRQSGPSSRRLRQHGRTSGTRDQRVGVGKDDGDPVTARAHDVHEETVRMLHQSLQFVLPPLFLR